MSERFLDYDRWQGVFNSKSVNIHRIDDTWANHQTDTIDFDECPISTTTKHIFNIPSPAGRYDVTLEKNSSPPTTMNLLSPRMTELIIFVFFFKLVPPWLAYMSMVLISTCRLFTLVNFVEQRVCLKCCVAFEISYAAVLKILQKAFGESDFSKS